MSVSSLRSFEYLESLPGTVFNKLYQQPSTALAIFRRMLPHLGMLDTRKRTVSTIADMGFKSKELRHGYALHYPPITGGRLGIMGAA